MVVQDIPIEKVDVSRSNTRKDLNDGQHDSSIDDLAHSIATHGLQSPVIVSLTESGRYALVAGQRRFLAHKKLGRPTIPAFVRDDLSEVDAIAISLVENVHRAEMNPIDKAKAYRALQGVLGDLHSVSRRTGVSVATIRKYLSLLGLSPELQSSVSAGEVKNTESLANLALRVSDPQHQQQVWDRIGSFKGDVQQQIIKRLDSDLGNLNDLVDSAVEGQFNYAVVRNCPFDCPTIPGSLKPAVARLVEEHRARN
jgi:ParB/RepB/Spo0J family partition protein